MRIFETLSLGLLASLALGACVAEVSSVPSPDDVPPKLSEAALSNTQQTAFNFFINKGLTESQSAAIVGNLIQESSVSATAVEYGGGPGRGIAQWSVGGRWDTSSHDNVTWYAATYGGSRWDLNTQLAFIWYEMNTVGGFGLSQMRSATTLTGQTVAFEKYYEICGTCAQSTRIANAQKVLAEYGGTTGGGGGGGGSTGSGGSGGDGATCYSSTLGKEMPDNACVQSSYNGDWYQCAGGAWVDRWSDPDACNGVYPL